MATTARCDPTTPRLANNAISMAVTAVAPQVTRRHMPCMVRGIVTAGFLMSSCVSRTSSVIPPLRPAVRRISAKNLADSDCSDSRRGGVPSGIGRGCARGFRSCLGSDKTTPAEMAMEARTPVRTCLAIVLAAGEGTRMRSGRPKVLHAIAGRSLLAHVLTAVAGADTSSLAIVVGPGQDAVTAEAKRVLLGVSCFVQHERKGTAHAVLAAKSAIAQ